MKRSFVTIAALSLVLALVLGGCVAAPEGSSSSGIGKIRIATDAAFPPMEFVDENKEIVGFDIDMMNAIAEAQGLEIEYKNTAWDGIFAGLDTGDYDAILPP